MDQNFLIFLSILDGTLRVSTPLILCAMAGLFSERSGIVDISLEGKLLASAFAAAGVAYATGSPWAGLIAAMLTSMAFSMLHGFACVTHNGNQVVSGVAINILASGLTVVLGIAFFHQGGQTPTLAKPARFTPIEFPFAESLETFPVIGQFYAQVISGHNILVYIAFLMVPLVGWVVFKTRFGLRLRAVGENPKAVDTAGINVRAMRYKALLVNGALCGMAGAYLSTGQNASFVREMSAGQGYIALAALIFGKWRPKSAMLACLMFGLLDAIAIRLQGVEVPGIGELPVTLIQALPYVLTVVLLAGFIGKAIPPKSIGIPYVKER